MQFSGYQFFWLYFKSYFFFYFSQAWCLLCQGSYFLYIFLCLIFNIFYLFSKKKVLIHSFIYELENELETYTLHKHVYIYKVCFFLKKKFNLNTWFIQSNNNLIFNHYSSLYIIVKERWLTIIYNHITNVFVKKKKKKPMIGSLQDYIIDFVICILLT